MFLQGNTAFAPRSFLRTLSTTCVTLCLLLLVTACGGSNPAVVPTPTPLQFTTIPLNLPAAAYNAPTVGPISANTELTLGVSFKVNPNALPKSQGKLPSSNKENLAKLANQYGITDATYQKIKAYLGVDDVTLNLGKLHSYMSMQAKASTIEKLFQTQFIEHTLNGHTYYVPAQSQQPKLPTFVMNYVVAITGLESYYTLTPAISAGLSTQLASTVPASVRNQAADCSPETEGAPNTEEPQQIAHAYGYDQFARAGYIGTGVTINLVELGSTSPSDLQNYFACTGFPASHFGVEDIIKPAAQPDVDGTEEATLDIEMIAGLAPGSNIMDYEASIPDPSQASLSADSQFELLNGALQAIIDNNITGSTGVNIVSISYGAAENLIDPNVVNAIDQSLQTLVVGEGMTVFASTGDCGAFGGRQLGQLAVQFPSTDPYVTAVGGTELATDAQGNRTGEAVWGIGQATGNTCTDNNWGGGGGLSKDFKLPSWQVGPGVSNQFSDGTRQVPDVAAIADNIPIYFGGEWQSVGGTSAATPIWASGLALVEQELVTRLQTSVSGPNMFYIIPDDASQYHPYYDITQGNNLFYHATPNWDDATGWGAPNLPSFYSAIVFLLSSK
jgi:kumamolisin